MNSTAERKTKPAALMPRLLILILPFLTLETSCDSKKKNIPEASALVSSCSHLIEPLPIGRIYTGLVLTDTLTRRVGTKGRLAATRSDCYLSADNCDDVFACTYANSEQIELCESGDYHERCSGSVLVDCYPYQGRYDIKDCGSAGLICAESERGASCGESHCEQPVHPCNGDILQECFSEGVLTIFDCSVHGGTCGTGIEGNQTCIGNGEECGSGGILPHCEGNQIFYCLEGWVASLDCANFVANGICVEMGPEVFCGLGNECGPDTPEECVDGLISFCHLGVLAEIDCVQLGYSGCDTFDYYDNQAAYCTPKNKTPCDELHDIQKDICSPADMCFPCVCVLNNEGWEMALRMGLPDIPNSSCSGPRGRCEGDSLALAERCLALGRPEPGDEGWEAWTSECDPRYSEDIWLFNDNDNYNVAFPEVCGGFW